MDINQFGFDPLDPTNSRESREFTVQKNTRGSYYILNPRGYIAGEYPTRDEAEREAIRRTNEFEQAIAKAKAERDADARGRSGTSRKGFRPPSPPPDPINPPEVPSFPGGSITPPIVPSPADRGGEFDSMGNYNLMEDDWYERKRAIDDTIRASRQQREAEESETYRLMSEEEVDRFATRERRKPKLAPGVHAPETYGLEPEDWYQRKIDKEKEAHAELRGKRWAAEEELSGRGWEGIKTKLDEVFEKFRDIAPLAAAQGGAGGLLRAGGAALGMAFPEIGIAVGIVDKLRDLPRELENFAESVANSNRALVGFSPAIAAASMRLTMGDFQRNWALALETEGTGAAQMDAVNRMRDALHPWNVLQRDVQNRAGGLAAGIVTGGAEAFHLQQISETLRTIMDMMPNAESIGTTIVPSLLRSIPQFAPLALASDALNAVKSYFTKAEDVAKQEEAKQAAEKARMLQMDPWQNLLLQQTGNHKIFPRINADRNANPTQYHQRLDAHRHGHPPNH